MHGEDTNPLIPLEPPRANGNGSLARLAVVLSILTGLGGAVGYLIKYGPFESKEDAAAAHAKLQEGMDAMREEHRAEEERVIEAVNKLGDRLGRRK